MSNTTPDTRTPSPPYGYSRPCDLDRDQQIDVVARFHANKIRPNRIAYRMGIDIALVEALIAGEVEPERFTWLVERYRGQRYRDRMRDTKTTEARSRYELQRKIEDEYQRERIPTAGPQRS